MARSILKIVSLCSIEVGKKREKALKKNIPARNSISIIAFTLIHTLHIFHVSLSKLGLRASFHLMYFTQFQKQEGSFKPWDGGMTNCAGWLVAIVEEKPS